MTTEQAEQILRQANAWRRDSSYKVSMPDPNLVTQAIDKAIEVLTEHNLLKDHE